jgi:hypothetical protein
VIVVRRGDKTLFAELQEKWRDDARTLVIFDRRQPVARTDATVERRRAANAATIAARGFYSQRLLGRE